jgi:hypothetical protein
MILPTKHLVPERSLLHLGGEVLILLDEPKTISRTWDELKKMRLARDEKATLQYDWFVLALDLLCAINVVELKRGRLTKRQ